MCADFFSFSAEIQALMSGEGTRRGSIGPNNLIIIVALMMMRHGAVRFVTMWEGISVCRTWM